MLLLGVKEFVEFDDDFIKVPIGYKLHVSHRKGYNSISIPFQFSLKKLNMRFLVNLTFYFLKRTAFTRFAPNSHAWPLEVDCELSRQKTDVNFGKRA